ncbi:conserved hypothetical protein [Ricinus communis]|uniref:Uncharacterized protein n=1 Tax=Ricinus communis TaxID=3988 RepID=B9S0F5_RICCO|nr:conserved hypothetical protein [Ricinus communis]
MAVSQPPLTPSPVIGQGVLGSHLHMKITDEKFQELGTAAATFKSTLNPGLGCLSEDTLQLFSARKLT